MDFMDFIAEQEVKKCKGKASKMIAGFPFITEQSQGL
jgi:hypothetical protein